MEPLVKGHKLEDRYTLVELLHTSEHSQVWLAQDTSLRSRVALKVALSGSQVDRELIRNEFAMCAKSIHPAVVRMFDIHDSEEHTLLSMEYLSGVGLGELIGRPPAQFLPAMIELADALAHVHQQGLVHRDFKLSNGMLDARGHARLIDFGVASVKGEGGLRSGGSPRSMSPQQRAGEVPDAADDMYAFGVALFRLTEGRWPDADGNHMSEARKSGGALKRLVDQLLEIDPAQRPSGMRSVADELRRALSEQSNLTLPPDEFDVNAPIKGAAVDDDFENIEVVSVAAAQAISSPEQPSASRARTLGLLAVYGLVGAALLFYFLPKFASDREVTVSAPSVSDDAAPSGNASSAAPSTVPSVEPWKLAQEAKIRKEAEAVLEKLLEQQFFLEDERASVWANDEFEQIKAFAIAGDQAFRGGDFETALARYNDGKTLADTLAERSKTILGDTLKEAASKLASANSAEATRLFQHALDIEPESQVAKKGLERAGNLDEVLALVAEGEALEQAGQASSARDSFKRAIELDGQWKPAKAGLARVQRTLANSAYSRHMSDGFKALERGDFAASQDAFERAGRLRPGADEVSAALAQLDTAIRLKDVNRLQSRAAELERQGDLRGAEQQYQAILDKTPSAETASAMRRVREHAEVDEILDELLAQPSRLSNDSVFSSAQSVLERVDPYMSDPTISERATRLREYMQAAKIPQPVELRSDGKTDVLVYRVGRLGTLTRETLNLRPGEYTAVGTRTGYRDVRVRFDVAPGQAIAPIEVVCRERI